MSQAKVDKYKEEKKNRAKIIKKQKFQKYTAVIVVALVIGALVGIPVGRKIYEYSEKQAALHRTVASTDFDEWFTKYYNENYYDVYAGATLATSTDATVTE